MIESFSDKASYRLGKIKKGDFFVVIATQTYEKGQVICAGQVTETNVIHNEDIYENFAFKTWSNQSII